MARGADWSAIEVEACVRDYLDMLTLELNGQAYNKSRHREALLPQLHTCEVDIDSHDVTLVHSQWIIHDLTNLEGRIRSNRPQYAIKLPKNLSKLLLNQMSHLHGPFNLYQWVCEQCSKVRLLSTGVELGLHTCEEICPCAVDGLLPLWRECVRQAGACPCYHKSQA